MKTKFLTYPFFLFLLPVFFVFHGFTENFSFVSIKGALLLLAIYVVAAIVVAAFFFLLLKNVLKAAIMASFILAFNFFFGFIQDGIKKLWGDVFFQKYIVILIIFLALAIWLFIILKKRNNFRRLAIYLNVLLLVFIAADIFFLCQKIIEGKKSSVKNNWVTSCDSCRKPNVFIILLDGYPGKEHLVKMEFDNSDFMNQLSSRRFKTISNTKSNYLFTPYSLASILNMEYLDSSEINGTREDGLPYAFRRINENKLISFFSSQGYDFYNYSLFRMNGQAAPTGGETVPADTKLISRSTFTSRFERDIMINLASKYNWKGYLSRFIDQFRRDNDRIYDLTIKNAGTANAKPKIVFTHLLLPHDPYYIDEKGKLRNYDELKKTSPGNVGAFLSYVKYTNERVINLVDSILGSSSTPPMIILFSDHGYRYDIKNDPAYRFKNLLSIFYPGENDGTFPDSLDAVNFFPAILDNYFGQHIPYRKDSTFTFGF